MQAILSNGQQSIGVAREGQKRHGPPPWILSQITKQYQKSIVMQEASDAHSKTAVSDTVSTYQVSSVQLVTDKNLTDLPPSGSSIDSSSVAV